MSINFTDHIPLKNTNRFTHIHVKFYIYEYLFRIISKIGIQPIKKKEKKNTILNETFLLFLFFSNWKKKTMCLKNDVGGGGGIHPPFPSYHCKCKSYRKYFLCGRTKRIMKRKEKNRNFPNFCQFPNHFNGKFSMHFRELVIFNII